MALKTSTTIVNSNNSTVDPQHSKAFSSILSAAITLLTAAATSSNKLLIVDFQGLVHRVSHLLRHKERAEDILATYSGQRLVQSAVDQTRTSQAAIRIPFKHRPQHLISHQESLSHPHLTRMTTRSDLRRIYKWRMRSMNPNQEQEANIMVILNKRMLPNSASLSSRNHLQLLQLSLRQI